MIDLDTLDVEKFWRKVAKEPDGCWVWIASRTTAGYGNLRSANRNDYAHRVSYRLAVGPIPEGLHLDHLCRNRSCVRPDHLEAVTPQENVRRGAMSYSGVKSECVHGHDITVPENVYTAPNGSHRCRVCAQKLSDARTAARRASGDKRRVLKTHCSRGHEYTPANTRVSKTGQRFCRKCDYIRVKNYREKKRVNREP